MSRHQLFRDGVLVYEYIEGSPTPPNPTPPNPTPPNPNPPQPGEVPPITSMPPPFAELPDNGQMVEKLVSPGEVVGYRFVTRDGARFRQLDSMGAPNFFTFASWAIFDSGGTRVYHQDNQNVNSGGIVVDSSVLMPYGAGPFTFAVATNAAGNLATRFRQE